MRRLLFMVLLLLIGSHSLYAIDEAQERRIRGGMRLFRAMLAADEDITSKVDAKGHLLLLVVYAENGKLADDFAEELRQLGRGSEQGTVRGLPVDVESTNDLDLKAFHDRAPAGIFIVENLYDEDISRLVHFGIAHHIIVYSPFEGDVNRGVLGGLAIETRVYPYINLQTMRESKIRIKQFFLKVAKQYDP